jgi:hypothetical protein
MRICSELAEESSLCAAISWLRIVLDSSAIRSSVAVVASYHASYHVSYVIGF